MKEWYLIREGATNNQHRGRKLVANAIVLLTAEQAASHNKGAGKEILVKLDKPPADSSKCQFPEEFKLWRTSHLGSPQVRELSVEEANSKGKKTKSKKNAE